MSPPSLIDTHPNLAGAAPVALSYELFPPRSPAAAESLWTTIGELEATESREPSAHSSSGIENIWLTGRFGVLFVLVERF